MDAQYLQVFIDESTLHVEQMSDGLLQLERHPEDQNVISTIFRSAHTLKGMSAAMGFQRMATLTHQMEQLLAVLRDGEMPPTAGQLDALFAALRVLDAMVQSVAHSGDEVHGAAGMAAAEAALARVNGAESPVQRSASVGEMGEQPSEWFRDDEAVQRGLERGTALWHVVVQLGPATSLPAVRAMVILRDCAERGELLAARPDAAALQAGADPYRIEFVWTAGDRGPADLEAVLKASPEVASFEVRPVLAAPRGAAPAEAASAATERDEKAAALSRAATETADDNHRPMAVGRTLRVNVERLDQLINRTSELVMDKTRLEQLAASREDRALRETVQHLARVVSDLQEVALRLRMVPLQTVFGRFPRTVRDLARALGKRVELTVEGGETELDRTLIDELGDPLLHLVRNAIDHGLEHPTDRLAKGKPEVGRLWLRAYAAGDRVRVELEDDGRGIQREAVLRKAVANGWVSPTEAAVMAEDQVHALLFRPGFSTAEQVTEISGRGVGLDAVQAQMAHIGGHVRVFSKPGAGTRFVIDLPLTVSIVRAILVEVGSEVYAIPLGHVVHLDRLAEEEVQVAHGVRRVRFDDGWIPLLDLAPLLDVPGPIQRRRAMVAVRAGERIAAFAVTRLIGQQDVVQKPLGAYFRRPPAGVAGATILGDGRVAVMLDLRPWVP